MKLCYSGKYDNEETLIKVESRGGLYDHLGTKDLREAEKMAKDGNEYAGYYKSHDLSDCKKLGLWQQYLKAMLIIS